LITPLARAGIRNSAQRCGPFDRIQSPDVILVGSVVGRRDDRDQYRCSTDGLRVALRQTPWR
jgi:hypothetical protein